MNTPPATPPPLPAAATDELSRPETGLPFQPGPVQKPFDPQDFLNGKNLFRVGLGLLLLGLAFLLKYAIDQNWIGESARIAAGLATSGAMVGIGLKIAQSRPTYGQLLQGGGVAGLYLTTFVTQHSYKMINATTTTILLGGVAAIGIGLSLRAVSESLAIANVLGAIFVPAVVGSTGIVTLADAGYLSTVIAAATILYYRNEWQLLFWVTQAASAVVAFAGIVAGWPDAAVGLQVLFLAMWIAFVGVSAAARIGGRSTDIAPSEFGSVVGSLTLGLASNVVWSPTAQQSMLAAAAVSMAAVHTGLMTISRSKGLGRFATLQIVPAGVFLASAIVIAFDGPVMSLGLAIEGFALIVAGRRLSNDLVEYLGHVGFSMNVVWLFLNMLAEGTAEGSPLLNGPAVARLAVIGLVFALAILHNSWGESKRDRPFKITYAISGYFFTLVLLGMELGPINQGYVSAAWGLLGVSAIVMGTVKDRRTLRSTGVATLFGVAVKLLLVDLASVDRIWKITLFFGFGIALLVVGYWMSNDE